MNDMKKVLIVAISVVLVIAIAAGVSIGVMANTMNGLKDRVEELDQAYASDKAAMMAEIEAAKAANENLVTAADFEAKLAAALGEQNQTMQSLISTAVKNQIEELGTEGLTEAQVQAIIDAAVENCLTEADIDTIIADVDAGLSKDEVKKIVADYTAGTLTYGQIMNLIEDESYSLRKFLEDTLKEYTDELGKRLDADLDGVKDQIGKVEDSLDDVKDTVSNTVNTLADLQAALDNATGKTLIQIGADITGDIKITQKTGVDLVIDGNGYKFTGIMTVFGDGRSNGAETLTIKNINFVAVNGASSCIVSPGKTVYNKYSYAHNVTVDNCTFTDPDADVDCAAIRSTQAGDKNWTITDCTVDSTMHSLLWASNINGVLTIENCVVKSKNGMTTTNTANIKIDGCEFDTKGLAVRFGADSKDDSVNTNKMNFEITNSTLKSACEDGDAVIIFRDTATFVTLTLDNTTLIGTTEISGTTTDTTVIKK